MFNVTIDRIKELIMNEIGNEEIKEIFIDDNISGSYFYCYLDSIQKDILNSPIDLSNCLIFVTLSMEFENKRTIITPKELKAISIEDKLKYTFPDDIIVTHEYGSNSFPNFLYPSHFRNLDPDTQVCLLQIFANDFSKTMNFSVTLRD